jgi:putative flavoprotein involved in K+ transport
VFTPKDQIGDWLEMYSKVMELNYWARTECVNARFDEPSRTWRVEVERNGERLVLQPTQLILATGMSGVANVPAYPGADAFKGQQHHSSRHPGGDAWSGKKAVVIGANNSAHDICADLVENGADVTMVQRSSTHIVRSDSLMELVFGGLYSEDAVESGLTTDKADMLFASIPYKVMPSFHKPVFGAIQERDKDFYDGLSKAGFMLDFGDDDSGLFMKYVRRGSGYYIDVGASELIANGTIKLKSSPNLGVDRIEADAVILNDGTRLPADLIVYATGYGSMNGWAARPVRRRTAQHVEADTTGKPVVPRRQPSPVAALLAVPGVAAESAVRRVVDAGVQAGRDAPHRLRQESSPVPGFGIGPFIHTHRFSGCRSSRA